MEKGKYSIYKHTSPSGKVYIGITCRPVEHRWNHGKGYMNTAKTLFKSTIIKYGWDNIKHEVLFTEVPKERAKRLEMALIRHYKRLGISLNMTDGGDGCHGRTPWNKGIKVPYEKSNRRRGCHLSEEHKQKLSIAHKGKHIKGHKWTEEQRRKLLAVLTGKHHTEEAKQKISANSAFSKKLLEYDKEGNFVREFASAAEAARYYNMSSSWIARACRERTYCKGHIFVREEDNIIPQEVKYRRYNAGSAIVIKNIKTEEIKEFHSESSCARFLGMRGTSMVRKAAKKGHCLKGAWIVISINGEEAAPKSTYAKNKPKPVLCTNVETGDQKILPSITACKEFLGLPWDDCIKKVFNGKRRSDVIKGWKVQLVA